jgi:hypothetical protein
LEEFRRDFLEVWGVERRNILGVFGSVEVEWREFDVEGGF